MGLRWPYLETVNLSFIFTWGDGKIEDRVKVSTSPLFEGWSINDAKLRDTLNKNNMHGNTSMTWNRMTKLRVKRSVWHGIINRLFLFFQKSKT